MNDTDRLRRLLDKEEIRETILNYARGVDRLDMEAIRACYHPDAIDEHGNFSGNPAQFADWIAQRHVGSDNSMHFLSNCHIVFFSDDVALAETYFASRRVAGGKVGSEIPAGGLRMDEKLGRYIDRFERRQGAWRIARRQVVFDLMFMHGAEVAPRREPYAWSARDPSDLYATLHAALALEFAASP